MGESSSEYEMKPPEPRTLPSTPPSGSPSGTSGAGTPPAGFVPPKPVVLGPDDEDPDIKDAEEHRVTAVLAYLPGFFLIPLLFAPKSRFARYHANQGLLLSLCAMAVFVLIVAFSFVNWVVKLVPSLGFLETPLTLLWICGCLLEGLLVVMVGALVVVGLINASNGERKPLPVIGKITLIKPYA